MPLGGSNISWANATPAGSESLGLGDNRIRSLKTSVQEGLDNEHNWPATGGAATGYHKLGSARAHFGTQSRVSSGDTDGRLMATSDTSKFFHASSTGTSFIGGQDVLSMNSSSAHITMPQRHYWATDVGSFVAGATASALVTFPNSGYSGIPFVFASVVSSVISNEIAVITALTATQVQLSAINAFSGTSMVGATVQWHSIGTRVL